MSCKSWPIGLTAALVILAVTVFVTTTGAATENGPNTFNTRDGIWPYAGLIIDASGTLYGTTISGGAYNYGSVFELTPNASVGWREKVLEAATRRKHAQSKAAWNPAKQPSWLTEQFFSEKIQPALARASATVIARKIGVSRLNTVPGVVPYKFPSSSNTRALCG